VDENGMSWGRWNFGNINIKWYASYWNRELKDIIDNVWITKDKKYWKDNESNKDMIQKSCMLITNEKSWKSKWNGSYPKMDLYIYGII
jgi:hypothetical protein